MKTIQKLKKGKRTDAADLGKTFKDGVLKACDKVCGKKKSRRDQGGMWWWNGGKGYQSKKEGRI